MKLEQIHPNPKNPRFLRKEKSEWLEDSLNEFGDLSGYVFNKGGMIISAHQRWEKIKPKVKEVVVRETFKTPLPDGTIERGHFELNDGTKHDYSVRDWTPEKADRATIRANAQNAGEWDADILANVWEYEPEVLQDMGVPEFVFGEVDNSLNSEKQEAQEDNYEIPDEIKTDIVTGDLFEIGPHRLLCGDSTSADDVSKLLGGEKPFLMVTDPPYGIDLDTNYSKMGSSKTVYSKIQGDSTEFDLSLVINISPSNIHCIWGGDYFVNSIPFRDGTPIVWAKRHSEEETKVFGSGFEILWINQKTKRDIWFIRPINQSSERLGKHPTQKPVECMARPIKKYEGDVYDPFLGSGTTMVAAHQLNRRCYGMEIDPKYCQVIVDRMLKLDPTLEIKRNGRPYQK